VTVYTDAASVTRVINVDLPAGDSTVVVRDFPLGLDPSLVRVEGESAAKLTIGSVDVRPPSAVEPANLSEIDKRIEALKDQRADLEGSAAAVTERQKFVERFAENAPVGLGDKGEARPIAEWRAAFAAVGEEVAETGTAIRDNERKRRDLDREIAQLEAAREAKPPTKVAVRIEVSAAQTTKATLKVSYPIRGASWLPIYDARLHSGDKDRKPSLELVRRAKVTQSTGEDWSNVELALSTAQIDCAGNAAELKSLIVRYAEPRLAEAGMAGATYQNMAGQANYGGSMAPEIAFPVAVPVSAPAPAAEPAPVEEKEADSEIGNFQAMFKIPGRVSVDANQGARNLRISSQTIAPDLVVRAVPASQPTAFIEASFKQDQDAALVPGQVAIYRDGIFVGQGTMTTDKDGTVRLGFGADDKVTIARAVVKRVEGLSLLRKRGANRRRQSTTKTNTDERSFKTTIRNGHEFPVRVVIEDQLPVSENKDISVEMLPGTTPPTTTNLRDKRGVLQWSFQSEPGMVKEIKFAWRVRWPGDKEAIMGSEK